MSRIGGWGHPIILHNELVKLFTESGLYQLSSKFEGHFRYFYGGPGLKLYRVDHVNSSLFHRKFANIIARARADVSLIELPMNRVAWFIMTAGQFELLYLGKEYPLGYDFFRTRLKRAFIKNREEKDCEKIKKMIQHGEYVVKELETLYMLKKYRTLKRRYYNETPSSSEFP